VVDVSLLSLAAWNLSPDVMASKLYENSPIPTFSHGDAPNPLVGNYRTKDGRFITLMMLQGDRFFAEVMGLIGLPALATDERFGDGMARFTNRVELIAQMDATFASRTLEEWKTALATLSGAWAPMQSAIELHDDLDVVANGYIPTVTAMSGATFAMPANPVQFDEQHSVPTGAPEHGQHTEEVLLELGIEWADIEAYKEQGAIT
jgi:crotonobetainyl-CoA:carnitine CoA-transferase CaiB-like acyl-CoA transferase